MSDRKKISKSNNSHQTETKTANKILIAEDDEAKVYLDEFQNFRDLKGEDLARMSTHLNQPFEAVILDYRMPGMNGMEVAKEILALNPRISLLQHSPILS